MEKIKSSLSGIVAGVLLSLSLSFMLCIYAPFELFLTNQSEFWFSISTMVLPAVILFLSASLILILLFVLLRLFGEVPYYIALTFGLGTLVYLYIQGNFFVGGLPSLDGTDFDWSAFSPERIKSIVAFVLCVAAASFLMWKLRGKIFVKVTAAVSGCLALLLAVTLTTLMLTTELEDKAGNLKAYNSGEFEYSEKDNFIILVLDALDAVTFEQALANNPEFSDTFDDFTYYDNALAAYPFSLHSIPMILTGEWYENDRPLSEYVSSAMDGSPLINALEDKGYRMGIYDSGDLTLDARTHAGRFENQIALEDTYTSCFEFMLLMMKMSGLKYAPWDMKSVCYDIPEYSQEIRVVADDGGKEHFTWSNKTFYESLKQSNPITTTSDKTFRFIHLEGAHVPYKYDKDVNIIKNGTYMDNVESCLTISHQYLQRLKESGVYDNSVIVIMADHGYAGTDNGDRLDERMHAAVLVKGKGESGDEMKVSNAPISYADLAASFTKLIEGKGAGEICDVKDGDYRERRFLMYYYTQEYHMEEYIVKGQADDLTKMSPTGVVFDYQE